MSQPRRTDRQIPLFCWWNCPTEPRNLYQDGVDVAVSCWTSFHLCRLCETLVSVVVWVVLFQFWYSHSDIQVNLDSTLRKSSSHLRRENFYHRGYSRSLRMVSHVTNLTDAVALLTQATEPLLHGESRAFFLSLSVCLSVSLSFSLSLGVTRAGK